MIRSLPRLLQKIRPMAQSVPCEVPPGTLVPETCRIEDPESLRRFLRCSGAVLLRKVPMETASDFEELLLPLFKSRGGFMTYIGGTNDRNSESKSGNVLSTGTEPGHIRLREHQEMSYSDRWCGVIAFGCLAPPGDLPQGEDAAAPENREADDTRHTGDTTIARAEELLANVPADMVHKLRTLGLQHHFFYHDAEAAAAEDAGGPAVRRYVKSWQATLGVHTRAEAAQACAARGWSSEWCDDDGALHFWFNRPAFIFPPAEEVALLENGSGTKMSPGEVDRLPT